jgi:hypothetical protein
MLVCIHMYVHAHTHTNAQAFHIKFQALVTGTHSGPLQTKIFFFLHNIDNPLSDSPYSHLQPYKWYFKHVMHLHNTSYTETEHMVKKSSSFRKHKFYVPVTLTHKSLDHVHGLQWRGSYELPKKLTQNHTWSYGIVQTRSRKFSKTQTN